MLVARQIRAAASSDSIAKTAITSGDQLVGWNISKMCRKEWETESKNLSVEGGVKVIYNYLTWAHKLIL